MTKNEQLNQLFDEWENTNPLYTGKFVRDGIIDEDLFEKQRAKILFVCKESSISNENLRDIRLHGSGSIRFSLSIADWSYGLLNNFPLYDTINMKKRKEALKCVAIMNLKKSVGKSVSDRKEIEQHIRDNKQFLLRQIEIINPDIIIGGVTYFTYWQYLFDVNSYFKTGHGIKALEWNGIPIIDFYHPSVSAGRALTYSLLKQVFESTFHIKEQ
jgi:hypothetical protein